MKSRSTAILFFSRTVSEEAKKKAYFSVLETRNENLASSFIQNTQQKLKNTGIPVFSILSDQQKGDSFGEKLANAIEYVFRKGFENAIAVGNDCPDLSKQQLLEVNRALQSNDLVLGPTTKGGVYLIGINQEAYYRDSFIKLSWESPELASSWQKYASKAYWLRAHRDINDLEDLRRYFISSSSDFSKKLCIILNIARNDFYGFYFYTTKIVRSLYSFFSGPFRAPPQATL